MAKPLINDLFIKNKDLYTIIYNRRYNIIRRCYNVNDPAYKYYGGSGIDVCDEWLNESTGFLNFYNWFIKYNPDNINFSYDIDRIDNSKGYSPKNCRFVPHKVNMNNTRYNHIIEVNKISHTISEWIDILNNIDPRITEDMVRGWIKIGIRNNDQFYINHRIEEILVNNKYIDYTRSIPILCNNISFNSISSASKYSGISSKRIRTAINKYNNPVNIDGFIFEKVEKE